MHERLKGPRAKLAESVFAASLILAGCSPNGADLNPSNKVTPKPIFTPAETTLIMGNPTPTERVEKTLDEQAKEKALDAWLDTIKSDTQTKVLNEQSYAFLTVKAENLEAWKQQVNTVLNGGKSSDVLKVNFLYGIIIKDRNNSVNGWGNKLPGELEINNVSLASSQPLKLSDAEKANGLLWHGTAKLTYIERYHANYYKSDLFGSPTGNYATIDAWAHSPETNPFPNFSPWGNAWLNLELSLVNGNWQVKKNGRETLRVNIDYPHRGDFITPSEKLADLNCSQKDPGNPCKQTIINAATYPF